MGAGCSHDLDRHHGNIKSPLANNDPKSSQKGYTSSVGNDGPSGNLENNKYGSCDSGLDSVGSMKDIQPSVLHLNKVTATSEVTVVGQDDPLKPHPHIPAPIPNPRSIIYDPRKTHENYLKWSKTRLVGPGLDEDDLPKAVSNISLRIVTPKLSGSREMGRAVEVLDDRPRCHVVDHQLKPSVESGTLWTDPSFPKDIAMMGIEDVDWKRPKDICSRPVLFCDGTSRYDIGQGSAGTCWFLCILTSLADKPEYLSQIIPFDAYDTSAPGYNGIFHCRLWKLGSWEDVFIDDFLPVSRRSGKLWGAHSATDENEMWVALMEKAFAKFHGSYAAVKGGSAGDAFVTLTGGVEEDLHLDTITPLALFSRMNNALCAGSILACSVPVEHDGIQGLTGGHAYTINRTAEVPYRGRMVPLVRLRNPWGTGSGEWNGAWCDGAMQWQDVLPEVKKSLGFREAGDGEFWMALSDFYKYMWRAFVCNFTPDFNSDGYPNGLDRVWSILGGWEESRVKSAIKITDRFQKPKYTFTLSESKHTDLHDLEGVAIGMCPIVIQFLQEDIDGEFLYIRCDLFRIDQSWEQAQGSHQLLSELTNDKVYMGAADITYRYVLPPGRYIVIPTYSSSRQPDEPRSFCLRIFTTQKINCRSLDWDDSIHVYHSSLKYHYNEAGKKFHLPLVEHWMSEWRLGVNSGGQRCRPLYHTNPQYSIHIPAGPSPCLLCVCVSQELLAPIVPLGIDIYKVDNLHFLSFTKYDDIFMDLIPSDSIGVPLDRCFLSSDLAIKHSCMMIGGGCLFIRGHSACGYYKLDPGSYVVIVFSNNITDEKRFTVSIAANQPITCRAFQDQPGPDKEELLNLV